MYLKILSAKWQPFCPGEDEIIKSIIPTRVDLSRTLPHTNVIPGNISNMMSSWQAWTKTTILDRHRHTITKLGLPIQKGSQIQIAHKQHENHWYLIYVIQPLHSKEGQHKFNAMGPFHLQWLTEIWAWIINHINYDVGDVITHPCSSVKDCVTKLPLKLWHG